jgi:uncharacterized membrane protein
MEDRFMDENVKTKPPEAPPSPEASQGPAATYTEPVWTYRGYKLRVSEFTTAMVHMFRAEVQRANVWRQRLDTTTNWAVLTTGAALSFAFGQNDSSHLVIILNIILVTLFLVIEARRYRYYELWSYRVRLMETDFFAAMLVPPFHPSPDWAEALSEHLLHPHFLVSTWEAIGRRLRRNYLWIYVVLGAAWVAKIWLGPPTVQSWEAFMQAATVPPLEGEIVLAGGIIFYTVVFLISIATVGLQSAAGEVLPRYGGLAEGLASAANAVGRTAHLGAWFRPTARRQQLLTFIITDKARAVTERITQEMGRGVTSLAGTGGYTGQAHSVLMCALTLTEVPNLKAVVASEDPKAFVIVSPAQEVFGRGFMPLEET